MAEPSGHDARAHPPSRPLITTPTPTPQIAAMTAVISSSIISEPSDREAPGSLTADAVAPALGGLGVTRTGAADALTEEVLGGIAGTVAPGLAWG